MNKYKVILTDLDETLLDNHKTITNKNKQAIKKIINNNVKFIINSGRSYMSINPFLKELELDKKGNIGVCYNGSIIYETDTNRHIIDHRVKKNDAIKVIDIISIFDADILVYIDNRLIVEKINNQIDNYCKISKLTPIVGKFKEYINQDVSKILLMGKYEILKKAEGLLNIYNNFSVELSSDNLLEINKKDINKGSAVIDISKILNINISDIIAVGDNFNDISMIKKAGLGIAVANAKKEVKESADYVLESDNNNSIMNEIFYKFIK